MSHEGLDVLVDAEHRIEAVGNLEKDLQQVKEILITHAGPLQACFLIHECQVCGSERGCL